MKSREEKTGSLAKAFAILQKKQPSNKVKEWREVLAEVADLAGMVLQNQADGHESKFINKIVQVIGGKLRRRPLSVPHIMIGRHSLDLVNELNLWLQDGSDDVGILVIYGMSGIGKTTIAKFVYNSNYGRFEGRSFLENIKKVSQQPNGLVQLQTQLLSDILNGRKLKISSVSEGLTEIEDAISSKKVLLVLDDVDHMDQLDAVFRMKDQFYPGSKIIITTRHARLLRADQVTKMHEVETSHDKESLELFSWHAFGQDHPIEGYIEYSQKIVDHCGGLPLALKVLGSSMYLKDVWKSALEKLEAIPNGEIVNKLRVSYNSLQDDHDRKLFLHIACFFIGKDKDYIVNILDACDFYTIVGIQNLINRCLVSIDKWEKVQMHDMICGMGREIVRLESEKPWKRSRVWQHKDAFNILTKKNGTDSIEGLVLDMHMLPRNSGINSMEIVLETNAFARMHELKLLHLSHVQLNGSYAEFCTGLRLLCWNKFPLDSIPTDFPLGSLVVLEMQYSGLRQVFKGTKHLSSLKILDLSHSHTLTEITDFSFCPNLEKLILVDCERLVDVNESIGNLERLVYLNMKDCKNIRMLPENMGRLKLLETLIISGCTCLDEFPIEMLRNMEYLKVLLTDGVPIGELRPGRSSYILSSLPCSLVDLSLEGCNLSNDAFPREFSNLSSLRRLNLRNNPICVLPNCIKDLTRLDELFFLGCKNLKSLRGLPKLRFLSIRNCESLETITYQCSRYRSHFTLVGNNCNLVEWENKFKLEPIGSVDAELINLLGLSNLETMAPILMHRRFSGIPSGDDWNTVQGLYERGIFSTFFAGNEVPGQFSHKSTKSPISFTVPLRDYYRGLKVFAVYTKHEHDNDNGPDYIHGPIVTTVRNKSKRLEWIYAPTCYGIPGEGEDMIWLSLWKLKEQVHLEGGDEVVVSVIMRPWLQVKEFGIQLQENHNMMSVSTESSYYPCVVGGDLGQYQSLEYRLSPQTHPFWLNMIRGDSDDEDTTDNEEEQEDDRSIAAPTGSNNCSSCLHGWKVLITAAWNLTLSLSRRQKQQSESRG
ncbi:PREDICTED: TMV resistance protein N-like [Prunus mume]|uniref:TMV resistance protein N-like n=1 Tax=Prunus mume TaxID=102107 RepID=A0ABM0P030_PRUMU|nr:PREDICTED: TMV resistance protein N-like [Prunus mume]